MIIYISRTSERSKICERFDFFIKIKLARELWLLEGRLLIRLRPRLVAGLGRMMRPVMRLGMRVRLVLRVWNISLTSLTLDIVPVVTGSNVLIEHGPVSALEGVLFSIRVTEMINLKN